MSHWGAARIAVSISLGLLLVGRIAERVDIDAGTPAPSVDRWVRTSDGWEKPVWLHRPASQLGIHPMLIALWEGLACGFVLLAFPARERHSAPLPPASGNAPTSLPPPDSARRREIAPTALRHDNR